MGNTIVVAVRSALMDALKPVIQGTAGMGSIEVGFQFPTGNNVPREAVWTQSARPSFTPAALRSGRNTIDEVTSFDLMFRTHGPDITPQEAAERVIEIASVAVDWINDHKNGETLNVAGLSWIVLDGEGNQEEFPVDSGYGAGVRIPLKYRAYLA